MSRKHNYYERIDPVEFETLYPERLTQDKLETRTPLTLLVRTLDEQQFEAYRTTVNIERIQRKMGQATFTTVVLDHDYLPVYKLFNSMLNQNNDWSSLEFFIEEDEGMVPAPIGFLVAPKPDKFDHFLHVATSLDVKEHIGA